MTIARVSQRPPVAQLCPQKAQSRLLVHHLIGGDQLLLAKMTSQRTREAGESLVVRSEKRKKKRRRRRSVPLYLLFFRRFQPCSVYPPSPTSFIRREVSLARSA